MVRRIKMLIVSGVIYSLLELDSLLGNGLKDGLCRMICSVKRSFVVEHKHPQDIPLEPPVDTNMYIAEVIVLFLSIVVLSRYKNCRSNTRIEELLQESKNVLRETNEVLDKWHMKKVANDYSYLFDEPQDAVPMTFEVPILHMAFLETRTHPRHQMERGDGDDVGVPDPNVVTSILDYEINDDDEIESKFSGDQLMIEN